MSEVKRFRADHRHVVETEFDDAQFVGVADFDRVTAERDAALLAVDRLGGTIEKLSTEILDRNQRLTESHQREAALQALLTAADERADVLDCVQEKLGSAESLLAEERADNRKIREMNGLLSAQLLDLEIKLAEASEILQNLVAMGGETTKSCMGKVERFLAALKPAEGGGDEG